MSFTIEVSHQPHQVTFKIAGELDAATVPRLRGMLHAADPGTGRIVLDLADVSFLDSSAINLLLATHRTLSLDLREMVVANPSPMVRRVFEVVGITDVLHLA